jgi:RNA-binding protein 26
MAAYKSTEPIFNNRFIKVFWQNDAQAPTADVDGNVTEGGSATAAPIQNETLGRPFYDGPKVAALKRKADKEKIGKLMELHKMKTDLYAQVVDQQKMLLQKLKNTEENEQKKKFMEILKKTEETAEKVKAELEELGTKIRDAQQK